MGGHIHERHDLRLPIGLSGRIAAAQMTYSKYRAVRTNCGVHSHMSQAEAEYCCELQLRERSGELEIIVVQPNVFLTEAKIRVIPDWYIRYSEPVRYVYVDYKGMETQSWRRNRKLWMHYGPAPLEVVKKKGTRFFISETIRGKE
jgi:hypothetical protein